MVEEMKTYPNAKCLKLAKEVKTPVQMIIPSLSIFLASPYTSPKKYIRALAGESELIRMDSATHTFAESGNQDILFQHTLDWFNRF